MGEDDLALIRKRLMWAGEAPVQVATSYTPMIYAGSVDIAKPDTVRTTAYWHWFDICHLTDVSGCKLQQYLRCKQPRTGHAPG
jgi:hypothetical protein